MQNSGRHTAPRIPMIPVFFGAILLLSIIASSPHVSYLVEYRLFTGFFSAIALTMFLISIRFRISIRHYSFILIPVFFSFFDFILRMNIVGAGAWFLCAIAMMAFEAISSKQIVNIIKILFYLNFIVITFGFVDAVIHLSSGNLNDLQASLSEVKAFSNADTTINIPYLDFLIPRISYYLIQSSLIPAYIMLPFAVLMALGVLPLYFSFAMFFFIIISFGGNVYVALGSSLFILLFPGLQRNSIEIQYTVINILFIMIIGVIYGNIGIDSYVSPFSSDDGDYVMDRAGSGVARLVIIGMQVHDFISGFSIGSLDKNMAFGNIVLSAGLRASWVGVALALVVYAKTFKTFGSVFKKTLWRRLPLGRKFGISLLLALLIQSFIYNDYGFSLQYGFIMLYLIFRVMTDWRENMNFNERSCNTARSDRQVFSLNMARQLPSCGCLLKHQ